MVFAFVLNDPPGFAHCSEALAASPPSQALYHPWTASQSVARRSQRYEGGISRESAHCSEGDRTAVDTRLRCGYRDLPGQCQVTDGGVLGLPVRAGKRDAYGYAP